MGLIIRLRKIPFHILDSMRSLRNLDKDFIGGDTRIMLPYIGPVAVYPMTFVVGFLVAGGVAFRLGTGAGVGPRFAAVILLAALFMLLGGKAHSLLERGAFAIPITQELIYGYRYPGGFAAFIISLWVGSTYIVPQAGFALLGDIFAPALGFAIAIIRFGCFLSGCCFGTICSLPWAVEFPSGSRAWHAHQSLGVIASDAVHSLPVHPLQLYMAGFGLIMGIFLLWFQKRKQFDGQVFLLYLVLHGTAKFFVEFFRHDHILTVQLMALAMALVGAALLGAAELRRQPSKPSL